MRRIFKYFPENSSIPQNSFSVIMLTPPFCEVPGPNTSLMRNYWVRGYAISEAFVYVARK